MRVKFAVLHETLFAMPALLISHACHAMFGADLRTVLSHLNLALDVLVLPADKEARLAEADISRVEIAFFSQDLVPDFSRQFFSAVRKAPSVKWLHVFNVGVDHPATRRAFDEERIRPVVRAHPRIAAGKVAARGFDQMR